MRWEEFRDDDRGYLAWIADHPDGYVINILRSHSPANARLHHAGCWTISGEPARGGAWTGPYVKVCCGDRGELEQWALEHTGAPVKRCGACHSARDPAGAKRVAGAVSLGRFGRAASSGRTELRGPAPGRPVVEAWADDYIRFERRPEWQQRLRKEIRARARQLEPSEEQVLHATFFGAKLPNQDVENLVLYYINSFRVAGRRGVRFELAPRAPRSPTGSEYPYAYRYELAPRVGGFVHWRETRRLARFDWAELGSFSGEKKLAQVWLALARGDVEIADPVRAPDTPFSVRVTIRPPLDRTPVIGGLLKGIRWRRLRLPGPHGRHDAD